jgi:hypothetical protein
MSSREYEGESGAAHKVDPERFLGSFQSTHVRSCSKSEIDNGRLRWCHMATNSEGGLDRA